MQAEKISYILRLMEELIEDTSIPKNIRKAVSDAKEKVAEEGDIKIRASSAIYLLDSISEDINMPIHARTQIWTILSELESLKEE
ncbi:MAG: UPF0147 family protein [Candidatus Anstonellales archaeon]